MLALSATSWADREREYEESITPYLEAHCVKCHGPEKQKGKFRVDTLTTDFADLSNVAKWIEVRDNINLGEMPPDDEPLPSLDDSQALSEWVALGIKEAETSALAKNGRVLLRRLTRAEYTNTLRDLLHMEFLPGESPMDYLPPDGKIDGFDKVSAGLMLDPSLMEKYYEVARLVAEKAIVSGPPEFPTEVMRMEFEETAENRAIAYLCDQPGFECKSDHIELFSGRTRSFGRLHYPDQRVTAPVRGNYRVSVQASAKRGQEGHPVKMLVTQSHPDEDKKKIMEVEVEASPDKPQVYTVVLPRDPDGAEWQVSPVEEIDFTMGNPTYNHYANRVIREAGQTGDFTTAIRYTGRMKLEGGHEGGLIRPDRIETEDLPALYLDWIEIEGPLYEQWPPKSHETIFPEGSDISPSQDNLEEIFSSLLPRAWRRPVADEEVMPYVDFVLGELVAGRTLEQAVRAGLAAVLTSPHFLYIYEPSEAESPRDLSHWEIASRLSYLLWSSMPDEELFNLAKAGRLRDPQVLEAQVDRMLADEKVSGFVNGFGAQWLRTGTFRSFEPDARQYKTYDRDLGAAMVGETLAFFREILREDLDLRNFIDSDFTMANERLAEHYGLEGVKGETFQRVSLPAELHRGGLLGQAGVLMAGSDGDRTKPVSRGVYVLEVLFNDPPNPPPPNAGEIEPNIEGENLSVRDRLIQHQQIETCAACHRGIDPYGLALENYDVIGSWRTHQNGEGINPRKAPEILASGKLPNGQEFSTPAEFKALLLAQDERFFQGITEKILVYALGRPHLPTDHSLVESISTKLKDETPTFRTLLKELVTSEQFLEK